jgi:hypothetical protein
MPLDHFPNVADLAGALAAEADRYETHWHLVHELTAKWLDAQPDLLGELRCRLRALPETARAELAAASRETTTHFAWRLAGAAGLPFSFWLHEYKPQRDWWRGYANSVHNHRYHFCTTVLNGGFQHEWYDVRLDSTGELAHEVACRASEVWRPGPVRSVTADQFHRVARATDGTLTFLVKSRAVREWSVSVDPATRVTRRHVPVEVLSANLAERI